MKRSFFIFSIFYFIFASIQVNAQDSGQLTSSQEPPRRRQALVLDIESRVLGEEQKVVWSESNRKVSIPGIPVGVQLEGSNIVLVVQFTPYIRREGNVLVAQGQIWIADSDKSVTYYTSIQTIPMEFGEPILFYPLGSSQQYLNPSIEIVITVSPYNGEPGVRPEAPARMRDGK